MPLTKLLFLAAHMRKTAVYAVVSVTSMPFFASIHIIIVGFFNARPSLFTNERKIHCIASHYVRLLPRQVDKIVVFIGGLMHSRPIIIVAWHGTAVTAAEACNAIC